VIGNVLIKTRMTDLQQKINKQHQQQEIANDEDQDTDSRHKSSDLMLSTPLLDVPPGSTLYTDLSQSYVTDASYRSSQVSTRKTLVEEENSKSEIARCLSLTIIDKKWSVEKLMYYFIDACAYCHIVKKIDIDA
jgi:hypothetical protein